MTPAQRFRLALFPSTPFRISQSGSAPAFPAYSGSVSSEGCRAFDDPNADPFPSAERRPSPTRGFPSSTSERLAPATELSPTLPTSTLDAVQDAFDAAAWTKLNFFFAGSL